MAKKYKKHIPFKKRREIAKRAKTEAGIYGRKRGRKNKVEGSTARDYSEKTTSAAIKDYIHNVAYKSGLTKKRYRLPKAEGGSHLDPPVINTERIPKPKKEITGFKKQVIDSPKTPGGESTVVGGYDVDGKTEKDIEEGVKEKEKELAEQLKKKKHIPSTALPENLVTKEGEKTLKRNEEEESEYQKARRELKERQKKLSYSRKDGVRTQEENAKNSRRRVSNRDHENKYGVNRGKRKLKRKYKRKFKKDYRKQINS